MIYNIQIGDKFIFDEDDENSIIFLTSLETAKARIKYLRVYISKFSC